jgi:hypothetical protein
MGNAKSQSLQGRKEICVLVFLHKSDRTVTVLLSAGYMERLSSIQGGRCHEKQSNNSNQNRGSPQHGARGIDFGGSFVARICVGDPDGRTARGRAQGGRTQGTY